jgi:hypothetical protein
MHQHGPVGDRRGKSDAEVCRVSKGEGMCECGANAGKDREECGGHVMRVGTGRIGVKEGPVAAVVVPALSVSKLIKETLVRLEVRMEGKEPLTGDTTWTQTCSTQEAVIPCVPHTQPLLWNHFY